MITLIIILVMLAVVLAIALAVSMKGGADGDDRGFRDKDGDHVYYDESIIEKKRYSRLHPKEAARTFTRLFRKR